MNAVERTELIACMEAGTAARAADLDHGANPHLQALRNGVEPPESHMAMERISAWWDGWEEADRALSPRRVWREHRVYF